MIRLYGIRVLSSGALNMIESLHLIIAYLLKDEWKDLKSILWLDG